MENNTGVNFKEVMSGPQTPSNYHAFSWSSYLNFLKQPVFTICFLTFHSLLNTLESGHCFTIPWN